MLNTNRLNAAKKRQYPAPTSWLMYSLAYSAISVAKPGDEQHPEAGERIDVERERSNQIAPAPCPTVA